MEAVDAVALKGWVERLQGLRRIHSGTPSEEPTKLEEWLYVGGNLANLGPGAWAKWFEEHPDVTHVVNCAAKDVKYTVKDTVSVLNLPALDEEGFDLFSFWPKVKDFVLEATGATGVLFHCQAGVNRSATLALAIWCVREQRPLLQVLRQGLQRRPGMLQNRSFQRQLIQCVQQEGVLGLQEDVDAWHAEMDSYQKQVHRVFELFASDGVANFDLFQKVMQAVGETAEDQWRRMMMYRPLLPVAGGQLADTVDQATVENWLQASPEIFQKLLEVAG